MRLFGSGKSNGKIKIHSKMNISWEYEFVLFC